MEIQLVETKEIDYEKVVDLFFEVGFLRFPKKRNIYKDAIQKAFNNSQYVVAAFLNKELIGFVRVLTDEALFATLWNMIVKPKYQKKGIGKLLIEKCLDKYPNLHFFLIADDDVVDFYKKSGFKIHPHGMYLEKGRKVCILYN